MKIYPSEYILGGWYCFSRYGFCKIVNNSIVRGYVTVFSLSVLTKRMNYTLYELWEYLIKSIHEKKYSKCSLNKHEKWHLSKIPIVLIFCKYDLYLLEIKIINFIQLLNFSKKSKNDENFNPVSKLPKHCVLALIIKEYNLEMITTLY